MVEFDKYEIPVDLDDTEIEEADPELAQKTRNYRDAVDRYYKASEDCEIASTELWDYWNDQYGLLEEQYSTEELDEAVRDGVITEQQKEMLEESGY